MTLVEVNTSKAPGAVGPYSQAIRSGGLLFFSGQLPVDPATGRIEDETIEEQTLQVFRNIRAILRSQGLEMRDVVKTTIMLADIADFEVVNRLYADAFVQRPYPARSAFQVAALPKAALIEIDGIVALP